MPLLSDEDLAFQMSTQGAGKGLYWDTKIKPISKGR